MNYEQFILDIYLKLNQEMEQVLRGLTIEELNYMPKSHSNSIGWLIWHSIRSQDRMNADLLDEDQLWISGKWYARFNRPPDPKDTGMGHTIEQVAAFQASDAKTYLSYYQPVLEKTRQYIQTRLSPSDLQREVYSPTLGTTNTVEARLLGTINNLQHIGQAGYIKGMLKGIGWNSKK